MTEEKIETKASEFGNVQEDGPSGFERLGAVVCHTGGFIGLNIIIPLVFVLAVDKEKRPFVFQHAKQALVFQLITFVLLVLLIVGGTLSTAGAGLLTVATASLALPLWTLFLVLVTFVFALAALVLICIASFKAAVGKPYTYPFLSNI